MKPPVTNSINLIGSVTIGFFFLSSPSISLLVFAKRAAKRVFIFVANSRIYSFFFFYFLSVCETRNKIYSPLVDSSMGDKISFKIIVESCPTGFDFVYDLNCVANLTKKVNDAR